VEPFLSAKLTKEELVKLCTTLGGARTSSQKKIVGARTGLPLSKADHLVKHGLASYLVTDWRYNEEKHVFVLRRTEFGLGW